MGASRIYSKLSKKEPFSGYGGGIITYRLQHDAATNWVSQILPDAFGKALDFSSGDWFAPLPAEIPDDVANTFESGVLAEPPVSEWKAFDTDQFDSDIVEQIAASMHCSPSELIVVPKVSLVLFAAQWVLDYLGSISSAIALIREMHQTPQPNLVFWQSAMGCFYPAIGLDLNLDKIANLMNCAADVSSEFILLTSSDQLDPLTSQSLADADLSELVSHANGFILGAYDGEGYIYWRRKAHCS